MSRIAIRDDDWYAIDDPEEARGLERELAREMPRGHILLGRGVRAIARCGASDDVLYRLDDGTLAQVHLTWNVERNPLWPGTSIYPDLAVWQAVPPEAR